MTVKNVSAKRTIKVPRSTIRRVYYKPPTLPDKSPVDRGVLLYGNTIKGKYIVPRFVVSNIKPYARKIDKWWVMDMEKGNIAKGTKATGYYDKRRAIKDAKKCRNKHGSWARLPF